MLKVNIENITLSNNSEKHFILSNIKFELFERKVYTILGKNGSGKSTLIKSLTGLLNDNIFLTRGTVLLDGKDILTCDAKNLQQIRKNKIRYVFQDAVNSFDPLRTFKYYFENSLADKNQIEKLLKYFLLPGYDEVSRLYPYEVSGGMAQRLSTVLAFAANPILIIFDEPTSGVDYAISNLLLLKLKDFTQKENRSVLLVTQDINFAEKISDEITFLSDGTITQFKTKSDFFTQRENDVLNSFFSSHDELK